MKGVRKIFLAINLDEKTKKHIEHKLNALGSINNVIKKIDRENYHITLVYLGFVEDKEIADLCFNLKESLNGVQGFDLLFDSFSWGPGKDKPKMLWLIGKKNLELMNLRCRVELAFKGSRNNILSEKKFRPHINLGRIIKKQISSNFKFSDIEEGISVSIPVECVSLMESVEEKGRIKYLALEDFVLS
ncbi:MAG: RNA 2',3'-cyclic phosphodiesterase [Patescibacteria group bacterium]|jgi:2'-5' RNA ligase|nr:RNA 2',3'-cyclic phosphodiesterase [Patescibacteria group bacterium]